jgi:hypothetical protein
MADNPSLETAHNVEGSSWIVGLMADFERTIFQNCLAVARVGELAKAW